MNVEQQADGGSGESDAKAPAAEVVEDELQEMKNALGKAEQELALHRDAMLRMQAEMENLRKRLIRDLEKSRKFALERIMKDLLQVRDSMERGLEADAESATAADAAGRAGPDPEDAGQGHAGPQPGTDRPGRRRPSIPNSTRP